VLLFQGSHGDCAFGHPVALLLSVALGSKKLLFGIGLRCLRHALGELLVCFSLRQEERVSFKILLALRKHLALLGCLQLQLLKQYL
jgi:hypothetical protein